MTEGTLNITEEEIRKIIREELAANNGLISLTKGENVTGEGVRKIIKEELAANNALKKDRHTPFAVYMGDGTVLTRSFYDIMYLVSSYDCTMSPHFILHGVYESELTKYFINNLREDSVFLDVGANFGYYTCMAAKKVHASKGGKVYSFEANKHAFALLQKNVIMNWIDWNAVSLNLVALSDKEESVFFKNYKYRFGGSQFYMSEDSSEEINAMEVTSVNTKKLDAFFQDGQKIDFIKIDVEGAEFKILRGAENIMRANPEVKILLEWDNGQFRSQGISPADFVEFLKSKKLSPYKLDWQDGSTHEVSYDYLNDTNDHLCGVLFINDLSSENQAVNPSSLASG